MYYNYTVKFKGRRYSYELRTSAPKHEHALAIGGHCIVLAWEEAAARQVLEWLLRLGNHRFSSFLFISIHFSFAFMQQASLWSLTWLIYELGSSP